MQHLRGECWFAQVSIYFSQLNITVPFVSTEEIEDSKILVEKELGELG